MQRDSRLTRRTVLATLGTASTVATAGCGVLGGDDGEADGGNGSSDDDDDDGTAQEDAASSVLIDTDPATTVGSRSAVLNGELDDLGGNGSVECSFEYRESGGDWTGTPGESRSLPGEFSRKLSELSPETEYEFRAVGSVGDSSVAGAIRAFETRADPNTAQVTSGTLTLSFEGEGDDRTPVAEVAVRNEGGDASGRIELTVTWYDDERAELGTSTATLETLGVDGTWLAQITPGRLDDGEVASVTADTTVEQEPPRPPEGVSVRRSELRVEDSQVEITGSVENTRGEAVSVDAIARVLDEQGRIIADSLGSASGVPAGGRKSFVASFVGRDADRIGEDAAHEVLLDGSE